MIFAPYLQRTKGSSSESLSSSLVSSSDKEDSSESSSVQSSGTVGVLEGIGVPLFLIGEASALTDVVGPAGGAESSTDSSSDCAYVE